MRTIILSALFIASTFQTAFGILFSDGTGWDGDWLYYVENNKAVIDVYTGRGGAVTIPSTLDGYPVSSVAGSPGGGVFVRIPYIRDDITSITIPNSLNTIHAYAFYGLSGLSNLIIPSSVTTIEEGAFDFCNRITVEASNPYYCSDESGILFNKDKSTIVKYPCNKSDGAYLFPDSVTRIASGAFAFNNYLTTVNIPNFVTSIGRFAFAGCENLFSVSIPSSVTVIDNGAFSVCFRLTSITIPNSIWAIGGGAFEGCSSLTTVTIPSSVTHIGDYAFYGCSGLTRLTIPSTVLYIGHAAFSYCWNMQSCYFLGEPPFSSGYPFGDRSISTVYYISGTKGWDSLLDNLYYEQRVVSIPKPTIRSLVFTSDGTLKLTWTANLGFVYNIESTDSLFNPFISRTTITASNEQETWTDSGSSLTEKRFYRIGLVLP